MSRRLRSIARRWVWTPYTYMCVVGICWSHEPLRCVAVSSLAKPKDRRVVARKSTSAMLHAWLDSLLEGLSTFTYTRLLEELLGPLLPGGISQWLLVSRLTFRAKGTHRRSHQSQGKVFALFFLDTTSISLKCSMVPKLASVISEPLNVLFSHSDFRDSYAFFRSARTPKHFPTR